MTATSRISGSRSTLNVALEIVRVIVSLGGRPLPLRTFFTDERGVAATWVSKVVRLEEAMEPFEEELGVGGGKALNRLAGTSMMSSKLCFLLDNAGMMLIALGGCTTDCGEGERGGNGGVSSRG